MDIFNDNIIDPLQDDKQKNPQVLFLTDSQACRFPKNARRQNMLLWP